MTVNCLTSMKSLVAISAIAFLISCSGKNQDVPEGAWAYMGYDHLGTQIVDGWFRIEEEDSILINGSWRFDRVGEEMDIGPQIGSGQFTGGIEAERIWMNLNPNMADNNVFLSGNMNGDRITGSWTWSGFAGPIASGSFSAEKNEE